MVAFGPHQHRVLVHTGLRERGNPSGQDDRLHGAINLLLRIHPADIGFIRLAARDLCTIRQHDLSIGPILLGHLLHDGRPRLGALIVERGGYAILHPVFLQNPGSQRARGQRGREAELYGIRGHNLPRTTINGAATIDLRRGIREFAIRTTANLLIHAGLGQRDNQTVAGSTLMLVRNIPGIRPSGRILQRSIHIGDHGVDGLHRCPVRHDITNIIVGFRHPMVNAQHHGYAATRGNRIGYRSRQDGMHAHAAHAGVNAFGEQRGVVTRYCGGVIEPRAVIVTALGSGVSATGLSRILHRELRCLCRRGGPACAVPGLNVVIAGNPDRRAI